MKIIYFKKILVLTAFFTQQAIISQTPNNTLRLARQMESDGRFSEARQIYETLLKREPDNVVAFDRLKTLFMNNRLYEEAKSLIELQLARHPGQPDLPIYLGQVLYRMGEDKKAFSLWDTVLKKYGREQHVYHLLASVEIQEQLTDKAIETYKTGRKISGDRDLYAINLASLYLKQMDYQKSIIEYLTYYRKNPEQVHYIESQIAQFPTTEKVIQEIEAPVQSEIQQSENPKDLEMILIKLYIKHGHFSKAFKFAKLIERQNKPEIQGRALYELATEAFSQGAVKEAKSAYQEIITYYPHFNGMDQVMLGMAKCEESQSRFQEAIMVYRSLFSFPVSLALIQYASLRIAELQQTELYHINEAIETYRNFLEKFPKSDASFTAEIELGHCYMLTGDLNQAEKQLRRCVIKNPSNTEQIQAALYLSQVYYFKKNYEQALAILDSLSGLKQNSRIFQQPAMNDALQLRLFIQTYQNDNPILLNRLSETDFLVARRKFKEAQSCLDHLIDTIIKTPAIAEAWFRKGDISEAQKEPDIAIRYYSAVVDSFPQFILADKALAKCGELYEFKNKPGDAIILYEKLLTTYPHSLLTPEIRKRLRLLRNP